MLNLQLLIASVLAVGSIETIHGSYRIMLGRNATFSEAQNIRAALFAGQQISYAEPLMDGEPTTEPCQWVGITQAGKMEVITEINQAEFVANGKQSPLVIALLRLNCLNTDQENIKRWTLFLDNNTLQATATSIRSSSKGALCSGVLNDVHFRLLGRSPNVEGCDPFGKETSSFDCHEIQMLAQGLNSIFDYIHNVRSMREYLELNLSKACQQLLDQYNPHGIGEYVSQLFHVGLGRRPTKREMMNIIGGYYQGDTRKILAKVGQDINAGTYNIPQS